jgi:hypothetical protein
VNATKPIERGLLATAEHRPGPAATHDLAELLDEVTSCIDAPSGTQAKILARLNALRPRLIHLAGAKEYSAP